MTTVGHIILPASFNNAALPSVQEYGEIIGGYPGVEFFGSVIAGKYTSGAGGSYDGLISNLANRKTGSSIAMTQAVSGAQPSLDLDFGPNGRGAMRVFASGTDTLASNTNFPVAGDHFKMAVLRADAISAAMYPLYSGTTGNRHMLQLNTTSGGSISARVGPSTNEAHAILPFPLAQWNIAITAWDATGKTSSLSLNGGAFVAASNASAVLDEVGAITAIGGGTEFQMSDVAWGSFNITLSQHGNFMDSLLKYARDILRLSV